jgi:hypothetical protein
VSDPPAHLRGRTGRDLWHEYHAHGSTWKHPQYPDDRHLTLIRVAETLADLEAAGCTVEANGDLTGPPETLDRLQAQYQRVRPHLWPLLQELLRLQREALYNLARCAAPEPPGASV